MMKSVKFGRKKCGWEPTYLFPSNAGWNPKKALISDRVDARYALLLDSLSELSEHARKRGLKALLIEPTPLEREFPWTIEMAQKMQLDLSGLAAIGRKFFSER